MGWLEITLGVLLVIVSILLVIVVVMQQSKQSGLQGLGGGSSDSFLSKNKGKTIDAKLSKITLILTVAFFVLVLGLNIAITYLK